MSYKQAFTSLTLAGSVKLDVNIWLMSDRLVVFKPHRNLDDEGQKL
jgi:hypothetical protein